MLGAVREAIKTREANRKVGHRPNDERPRVQEEVDDHIDVTACNLP